MWLLTRNALDGLCRLNNVLTMSVIYSLLEFMHFCVLVYYFGVESCNDGDICSVLVNQRVSKSAVCTRRSGFQSLLMQVDLQVGERIQYKYVILEEQVWFQLANAP
jgi:hypothetical protein